MTIGFFFLLALRDSSKNHQNMLETTKVLVNDEANKMNDKILSLAEIANVLNIDEVVLSTCNKKTATSTARALIKLFCLAYESNFEYSKIDKSIIKSIIGEL